MDIKKGDRKSYSCSPESVYINVLSGKKKIHRSQEDSKKYGSGC